MTLVDQIFAGSDVKSVARHVGTVGYYTREYLRFGGLAMRFDWWFALEQMQRSIDCDLLLFRVVTNKCHGGGVVANVLCVLRAVSPKIARYQLLC